MFSAINTAASGLNAASAKLNVAASNIANAESEGYTAKRVDLVDLSPYGVAVAGAHDTGQSVDLATETTELHQSAALYTANATVLKVADQLLGTLIDTFDNDNHHNDHRNRI